MTIVLLTAISCLMKSYEPPQAADSENPPLAGVILHVREMPKESRLSCSDSCQLSLLLEILVGFVGIVGLLYLGKLQANIKFVKYPTIPFFQQLVNWLSIKNTKGLHFLGGHFFSSYEQLISASENQFSICGLTLLLALSLGEA